MIYKILITIILSNLLSLSYAVNNTITPTSTTTEFSEALSSVDRYQYCFKNSTWIVPPQTLLAYFYDSAEFSSITDQTVWVISSYNQGYFFGQSYAALNNSILSQRYLAGSVTSEGKVYITFYSGTASSTDLINGIGSLSMKSSGQCYFTMQMNSGQNSVSGVTHWSYMIPVNPGDVFYNNLPGTNMSVPQFLAQF